MNWGFLYDHSDLKQHDQHVWDWKFWLLVSKYQRHA
jgi:hypothetical protein